MSAGNQLVLQIRSLHHYHKWPPPLLLHSVFWDSPAFSVNCESFSPQSSPSPLPGSWQRGPGGWAPRRCLFPGNHKRLRGRMRNQINIIKDNLLRDIIKVPISKTSPGGPCPRCCRRVWHWARKTRQSESSCRLWPAEASRMHRKSVHQSHPELPESIHLLGGDNTNNAWCNWIYTF